MKPTIKSLKKYIIRTIIIFTVLTIVYFINYQSNNSSIFAIENVTLVIGITVLVVLTIAYIAVKIYEKNVVKIK